MSCCLVVRLPRAFCALLYSLTIIRVGAVLASMACLMPSNLAWASLSWALVTPIWAPSFL
ncbi:hypothetical protein D3C72_2543210 [compost metagenome]